MHGHVQDHQCPVSGAGHSRHKAVLLPLNFLSFLSKKYAVVGLPSPKWQHLSTVRSWVGLASPCTCSTTEQILLSCLSLFPKKLHSVRNWKTPILLHRTETSLMQTPPWTDSPWALRNIVSNNHELLPAASDYSVKTHCWDKVTVVTCLSRGNLLVSRANICSPQLPCAYFWIAK